MEFFIFLCFMSFVSFAVAFLAYGTGDPSYGDDEFCKPLFADHSCANSDHWL